MSCTNPRIMAVVDLRGYTRVTPYGQVISDWATLEKLEEKGWKINYERKRAYRLISRESRGLPLEHIQSWARMEDMEIPCGHCIQCRLDYSKSWAIRCTHEASFYEHNYFVTLTIDDEHLEDKDKKGHFLFKGKTGNPSLSRDVLTQFIKSLRQRFSRDFNHVGIKFFGCGEYNSSGERLLNPHYHVILFNCPLNDLSLDFKCPDGSIIRKKSARGEPMFFSQLIKDIWKYGFITVEDANYQTESYVSKYILKKQGSNESLAFSKNLEVLPPFLAMSNRPAIGMSYFEDNEDYLIDNPRLIVSRDRKEPLVTGVPRFYKKKILERHPEMYEEMLEKAKVNISKARSLIKGKVTMNSQREAEEVHANALLNMFSRNF